MKRMKFNAGRLGIILATAFLSLGLSGCGDKKEENVKNEDTPEVPEKAPEPDKKEAPKVADTPAPEPKKEPAPDPKPKAPPVPGGGGGGAIAKAVQGYWAIDADAMIAMAKEQMKKEAGGQDLDPAMEQMAVQMIMGMAKGIMLNLGADGQAQMMMPGKTEGGSYRVYDVNQAAGTFKIEIDPPDEDPKSADAILEGDSLTISPPDGETMKFVRISEEEAKKRQADSANAVGDAIETITNKIQEVAPDIQNQLKDVAPQIEEGLKNVQPPPVPQN